MDEEAIKRSIEERYGQGGYSEARGYGEEGNDQNQLPSVKDPKLFSIPCRSSSPNGTHCCALNTSSLLCD